MAMNKEELMERLQDLWHYGKSVTVCGRNIRETISEVINILEQPTAEVEEVRHGEWEKDTDKVRDDGEIYDYRCSLCKGEAHEGEYGNNDVLADFCHHCGAKMYGGK